MYSASGSVEGPGEPCESLTKLLVVCPLSSVATSGHWLRNELLGVGAGRTCVGTATSNGGSVKHGAVQGISKMVWGVVSTFQVSCRFN